LKNEANITGPKDRKRKRSVRILWYTFYLLIGLFVLLIAMVNFGMLGYMPSMAELENPSSAISSEVLAADGTMVGRYYVQDRSTCKHSEISDNIYNALLATEDARFYEHSGIDAYGTLAIPIYLALHKKKGVFYYYPAISKKSFSAQE